jgi:nicotinate-nucleotide pyrophosphorylase (carboxylating)
MNFEDKVNILLKNAFEEDLNGIGDITTKAIFDENTQVKAIIKSKESGILSGAKLIVPAFKYFDGNCIVETLKSDGQKIENGSEIAKIEGKISAILAAERTILNLLQRLCGISTATDVLSQKIRHTRAKIIDTHKTTPALRFLEKEAVIHGGGQNHRFGLYDMILIKDTHVKAAGGAGVAVVKAAEFIKKRNLSCKIEIEVRNSAELSEVISLDTKPDRIMLDNMSVSDIAAAVGLRNEKFNEIELEASGNINENTVVEVAETGVDFISVGALTHSVKSLDIHLIIS